MPSEQDIIYSMFLRETENLVLGATGINVRANPLIKGVWEKLLRQYDAPIRGILDMLASSPPESIDAGCEVLKEETAARMDVFAEKMKEKIKETKKKKGA